MQSLDAIWPRCLLANADSPTVAALNTLDEAAWHHLIDQALAHDVAAYFAEQLRRLAPAVTIPPAAQARLREIARRAALAGLRRTQELRQILAALHAHGITPTLLKGAALAHTVYPTPACRAMVDYDLWLDDAAMPAATTALAALGYAVKPDPARTLAFHRRYEGELVLVGAGRTGVELHWGAFVGEWIRRTATVDRDGVVRRGYDAVLAGSPVRLLAREDMFLQVLLHLAIHHQMARHGLRSLLDLALLLRGGAQLPTILARAAAWRVDRVTYYVLALMHAVLGVPAQSELPVPPRGAAFSLQHARAIFGPGELLSQYRLDRTRQRYWLLALLADRPRDAAALIGRMIWPEAEWMQLRYGDAGLRQHLRHGRVVVSGGL